MNKIKLIIFDMDGVLCDLKEVHAIAFLCSMQAVCGWSVSLEKHNESLCGLPTAEKLKRLGIDSERSEKICKLKQEKTLECLKALNEDKNLQIILKKLRSSEYILYVGSNSLRETVKEVLTRLGIISLFHGYLGNDDVRTPKPSPEMYYRCRQNYSIWRGSEARCSETLIIEDSPIGKRTIEISGCHGLMVTNRQDVTLEKILNKIKEIEC